ncbi:YdcF family protein [Hydrogenimonas urashimensis]|uniref:YdcF family protein n=1 Tax=Hydrogenimonas urashimensis TaxID=2740515 RepID=UPI0019159CAE|nr:YdcF family protein [Hydrogenimonas urashimensis]
MGRVPKFLLFAGAALLFLSFLFFNLGSFLDTSQPPVKADLVVSLGGDRNYDHIQKAYELLQKGYSKEGFIMVNGFDYIEKERVRDIFATPTSRFLLQKGIPKKRILFMHHAGNTMEELRYVKNYLVSRRLHSVIIVSSPPHLRRIRFLAWMNGYDKAGICLITVGSDAAWWDPHRWYKNPVARAFVFSELVKFPYNFVKYAILEPLGPLQSCRDTCRPLLLRLHRLFDFALFHIRRC